MRQQLDPTFDAVWQQFTQTTYYRELAAAGATSALEATGELWTVVMRPITWLPMPAWTTTLVARGLRQLREALQPAPVGVALIVLDTIEAFLVFAVDAGAVAVDAALLVLQIQTYWTALAPAADTREVEAP